MNSPIPWPGHYEPRPASDSTWAARCAPLLAFLRTPRAWPELSSWARDRSISGHELRNMLAWLDCEALATAARPRRPASATDEPGAFVWRAYPNVKVYR